MVVNLLQLLLARPLGWFVLAVYAAVVLLMWYIIWRDRFRRVIGTWTAVEWTLVALILCIFCPFVYNYYREKGFL